MSRLLSRRYYLLFFLVQMFFSSSINAASLELNVKKTEVALGLPLEITLIVSDVDVPLSPPDLTAFERDFIVRNIEQSRYSTHDKGRMVTIQELQLRLYARRPGRFQVPSVRWAGLETSAISVNVLAQDPNGPALRINTAINNLTPWVREAVHVVVTLTTDRNLGAIPEDWRDDDMFAHRLPTQQTRRIDEGGEWYVTQFSWLLMPLQPGAKNLSMPLVKLGGRRLLPTGELNLDVKPLASYMPTFIPVGKVQLETQSIPTSTWLGEPQSWKIRIIGTGLSTNGLARLFADTLLNSEAVNFYPTEFSRFESTANGTVTVGVDALIVFKALQGGELSLPTLQFPYIDTATGQLNMATLQPPKVAVYNPWWLGLQLTAAALTATVITVVLGIFFRRLYLRRRNLRHLRSAIRQAKSAQELARELRSWNDRLSGVRYATLRTWLASLQPRTKTAVLNKHVSDLEHLCWAKTAQEAKLLHLKTAFIKEMR